MVVGYSMVVTKGNKQHPDEEDMEATIDQIQNAHCGLGARGVRLGSKKKSRTRDSGLRNFFSAMSPLS